MILGKIFDRVIQKAPVATMARAIVERVLSADSLNAIFAESSETQYCRTLLFSTVFDLMSLVVCRVQPSIHSAYQEKKEEIESSITSVYNKLNGIDTNTSRELVRATAEQIGQAVHDMGGARQSWLPGYRVKVLDGNCIEATEHRIGALRSIGSAALPGKSLVIYDQEKEMAIDVFPCEDGHAQERSLLSQVLENVEDRDVFVMDRNFCVSDFLTGIADQKAFYICRHHKGMNLEYVGKEKYIGNSDTGEIYERWVNYYDSEEKKHRIRLIRIKLKSPTRDNEKTLFILTNLSKSSANAKQIAQIYRKRWTIETAFQEIESHLHSEINTLGYPKAALFGFCTALVAYNVYALIKAALRSVHGEDKIANEVSGYYIAGHIGRTYEGLDIAVPEEDWTIFQKMTNSEFINTIKKLATKVDLKKFKKHKRGSKKPSSKRKYDAKVPHVSTAKILAS